MEGTLSPSRDIHRPHRVAWREGVVGGRLAIAIVATGDDDDVTVNTSTPNAIAI
jgi:hypothetical protein